MKYNFDEPVDRSKNFSAKHDELLGKFGREDVIPLWIADMDLMTAQPIIDAIVDRAKQGIFGYTSRPASYFEAACAWQKNRNDWTIDPALMSFSLGVVPAMTAIVERFTAVGDKIAFLTPVYSEFFEVTTAFDRVPLTGSLLQNGGDYTVDFAVLEDLLKQKPAMFILCNPHNPVGRVWSREELTRIGELCLQYNVPVISDEIHADLMLWGNKHTPFASISPAFAANCITCISATKTFNLAGLQASSTVFPTKEAKEKFEAFWKKLDIHRNNCFSLVAVEAAYRHGAEWLEQLLHYIEGNMTFVQDYCKANLPEILVHLPESTYLLWLDCRGLSLEGDALLDFMANEAKLGLNDGRSFGAPDGFMRLNVACARCTLEKAMEQLKTAVSLRR